MVFALSLTETEEAKKAVGGLAYTDEDLLGWILFPATMGVYLQKKYKEGEYEQKSIRNE